MKKRGFTLAEVLVTLGIVGVVAALTVPQLNANVRNQKVGPTLASINADIENAVATYMARDDQNSISTQLRCANELRYLKYISCSGTSLVLKNGVTVTINGGGFTAKVADVNYSWSVSSDGNITPIGTTLTIAQNGWKVSDSNKTTSGGLTTKDYGSTTAIQ